MRCYNSHFIHSGEKLLHGVRLPDDLHLLLGEDPRLVLRVHVLRVLQLGLRTALHLEKEQKLSFLFTAKFVNSIEIEPIY